MAVPCFIRTIDAVENLGGDVYRIFAACNLMDASNSVFNIQFDAVKGADWRIQARSAAALYALEHLGETVDFVIMPGLETL